jgi:hypothetical protein
MSMKAVRSPSVQADPFPKAEEAPRVIPQSPLMTQEQADRKMLEFLQQQFGHFKEGGHARERGNAYLARITELVENQATLKRVLSYIEDAQKLATAQMQTAQTALRQLERLVGFEKVKSETVNGGGNGKSLPAPAVDFKGE